MASRRSRNSKSLTVKSLEVALSAPQVVAHRVTRMALAGTHPTGRDRKEFQRMVDEKYIAFAQAWGDMALHAMRAQWLFTASVFRMFLSPGSRQRPTAALMSAHLQNTAVAMMHKGLAPIHRKTVANARRLAKIKRK